MMKFIANVSLPICEELSSIDPNITATRRIPLLAYFDEETGLIYYYAELFNPFPVKEIE